MGDVIVEAGARAILRGLVFGAVFNRGGHVEIHGTVGAVLDPNPAARTIMAYEAVITGHS